MRIITTANLNSWADSAAAPANLPYYVKKLICAVVRPDQLRFPSQDAVWLPGYDGELFCATEHRFVPEGHSVWEVGTDHSPVSKATSDYEKRKGAVNKSETTFVFVTPRIWKNKATQSQRRKSQKASKTKSTRASTAKDQWIARRMKDGWKKVIVLDGVDLQDWLEEAPAVALQLASEMSIIPEKGLQPLDWAWEEWSRLTDITTSEELVVIGREEQEQDLMNRIADVPNTFVVRGESPREAYGFSLATLRQINSKDKNLNLDARIIIAEDENVAQELRVGTNLIVVLKQTRDQVSGVLSSRGYHVLVPEGNAVNSGRNPIELARPTHGQFVEALGRMGLSTDEAERTARECGLSVTILQRRRPHSTYKPPVWSEGNKVAHLLPAVLAGRWNGQSEADRRILCELANERDYAEVEKQLQEFRYMDEPPLRKIGEMWIVAAPADAFELTARYLSATHLDRFRSCFREVFGKIDPKVDLPVDEWLYSDIKGDKGYSSWLRIGLADTLLLIAERGPKARLSCINSAPAYVDEIVKGLPGLDEDGRVLASIRDQYPRLMEAAPRPFLDNLEYLLRVKPNELRRLFVEGSGIFIGGNLHTGLLWGLETLAWSPEYLPQVTLILAKLASLDPGVRIQNRPINSLREIFLSWHPHTNATVEERLNAIDLVLTREPEIGWDLLTKLLPEIHAVSTMTARPRWRDFGDMPKEIQAGSHRTQYMLGIVDRAFAHVGIMPERWQILLKALRWLPLTFTERALEQLRMIGERHLPDNSASALWKVILDFVHEQRTYQSANWSLPKEIVDRFTAILPLFAPSDLIDKNIWLFDEWLPGLSDFQEDMEKRQEEVNNLREGVVAEVMQQRGVEGLVELGIRCNYPGFVAVTAVPLISAFDSIYSFIDQAISAGDKGVFLASHISAQAERRFGDRMLTIIHQTIERRGALIAAALFRFWPDGMATWEHVDELGISTEYWQQKDVVPAKLTPEEKAYEIDHLIQAKRSSLIFNFVQIWVEDVATDMLIRLFDATMRELAEAKAAGDVQPIGWSTYELQWFLTHLRNRLDLSREELARREYQALPLLRFSDVRGLTLHEFMANDPNFFVDVICDAYLPAHRNKEEDTKPSDEIRVRAQAAFTLLNGMSIIPGQSDTGFDEERLQGWVDAVHKRGIELDREVITDQQIGAVLAYSPLDPEDNGWPHRAIRNVIEKQSNIEIEIGLKIARVNMRGVVAKSLYEGGAQERELAKQYHAWVTISNAHWPRMARVLEEMAEDWEEHARREDTRAEQDKAD